MMMQSGKGSQWNGRLGAKEVKVDPSDVTQAVSVSDSIGKQAMAR